MPVELVEKALAGAKKLKIAQVSISGGEPCMHPEFEKIVEKIVEYGFSIGIVTNGSLPEKYSFLISRFKKNLSFVTLSLDGSTADVHDSIRQKGAFEKVINTAKYFSLEGVYISLSMCLNKKNVHQMEDFIILAKKVGAKRISFLGMIVTAYNEKLALSEKEKDRCRGEILKLCRKHYMPVKITNMFSLNSGVEFCHGLNLSALQINPLGEVAFCCDNTRYGAVVGSLKDSSFEELYSRCLDLSCYLKKKRVEMMAAGNDKKDFNSCEFCNRMLKDYIK